MDTSIFAKIVQGEIPCHKVYEDELTLAFLDIHPANEGHTLVIPKVNPAEFVWDLSPEMYSALMDTTCRVARRLREVLPYHYVHEAIVGTDVPYAHIHLIPFDETSQLHNSERESIEPNHVELAALAARLAF